MISWTDLTADFDLWIDNFDSGRGGNAIDRIVIHHNAGKAMSHQGVYEAFSNNGTSAHYNVDISGSIAQFVHDWDTAWHCPGVNKLSIGIEHANCSGAEGGWDVGPETIDAGAHLTAALCRAYGLGRPQWRVNVFPHSDFYSTMCPASLRDTYANEYIEKAQQYYDNLDADLSDKEGWVSQNGGWWYRTEDGGYETGWFPVADKWYYADEKGWLQFGWQLVDGHWYFLHDVHDGRYGQMETGWIKVGEHWFYLNDKGQMQTGWLLDKGKWYYLEANGQMRTGWLSFNGNDYFLTETGAMAVGLVQTRLDGACSIFGEDGKMLKGRIVVEQDADGIVKLVESK